MPSLGDSAVIIFLGLLLFGPKGLAQIARQLGKLMGEFRRASNEFRMQMEEELRVSEQEDRQKKIAAIEAAAPAPPVLASSTDEDAADHAHLRAMAADTLTEPVVEAATEPVAEPEPQAVGQDTERPAPIPIASSGDLSMMPPATGLPAPRSSSVAPIAPLLEAVPHVAPPNGHVEPISDGSEQKPMRYTNGHAERTAPPTDSVEAAAESVHG